jgi:DNA topoisomerase I
MAQIGESPNSENGTGEEKPKYARLRKDQRIETISLDEALELFSMPRNIGRFEDDDVVVAIGRFGPYVKHKSAFYSLKKDVDDPFTIELDRAIELIGEKREADRKKTIQSFKEEPELKVLNGRWGPYISFKKENYKIPKNTDPETLSLEDCKKIIEDSANKPKNSRAKAAFLRKMGKKSKK